jgi:hypothetical protein
MPANWIEKYPKTVALSLLGLLVAGAVASGLWIYSLRAAIHRQEAALEAGEVKAKEDRQSLEERHGQEVALLQKKNAYLSDQVTILRRTARELTVQLAKVTSLLNEATGSAASPSYKAGLSQAVGQLERQSDEMNQALERIDAGEPRPPEHAADAAPESPSETGARSAWLLPLVLAGTALFLGLLGFAAYLYKKHQDLERKEVRLNQREQRLKMAGPRPGTAAGRG